ncbi:hypothetical protein IEQ34_014859 [Dendrobium chrysotoxum]|uniref:Uncharacterized protein n=1 Tax=Dendrobium chrysotoxum TaxID=161865 RepID=A0AAV7GLU0_DENCH|nr:hypothetical protein IEQ34_014859 [Dendrobium chrysotoxum]
MQILALESADVGFVHVLDMRLECLVLLTEQECYLSEPLVLLHEAIVLQIQPDVHYLHIFFPAMASFLQPEE